jgi:choline dehydrogenase-like flavoprotein
MAESNHYDVIIIGSGAGGGTLAYKLAPTGKKILILERGGYVPREKDNWDPRAVNLEGRYQTKESGTTETATSCIRIRTTSAATRSFSARRCFVCAKKTSARSNITVDSHRPGRSVMTT